MEQDKNNVYAPTEVHVEDVSPAGRHELATIGSRLIASIVDMLIVMVLLYSVVYAIYGSIFQPFIDAQKQGIVHQIGFTLAFGALGIVIYAIVNWKPLESGGQSVGKKLLGIRIVRTDGSPVGARHVLLRRYLPLAVVSQIPLIGSLLAMLDSLFIFRASRKCLHDDIADTIVTKA